jgi:hypothetical protein
MRLEVSAQPLAKKTACLIEKETLKKRISNIEGLYSIYFYKKMERSDSTLRNSIFVIRYSAVRCSARLPATKAANLIIKKSRHFGVVSYKRVSGIKGAKF